MTKFRPISRVHDRAVPARYLLVSILVHLSIFYLVPGFEFKPYLPSASQKLEIVEMEPVAEVPLEPEMIRPPQRIPYLEDGGEEFDKDGDFPRSSPFLHPEGFHKPEPTFGDEKSGYYVFDKSPILINSVSPEYPRIARIAGFEGRVLFKVLVDTDGTVMEAITIHSSVTMEMEAAAKSSVMQFVFEPAMQGNVKVRAWMAVPVTFRLH